MVRATIFSVGLLLATLSAWLFVKDVGARGIVASGAVIVRGAKLTLEDLDKLAAYNMGGKLPCRRDIQEGAMSLALGALETRLEGSSSPDDVDAAYLTAIGASQRYLSCFPLASNAWMRSAMTAMLLEGPVEKVFSHIELSQLTGPREAWILSTRIPFLMSLRQTNDVRVVEALNRDLDTLFRGSQVGQAGRIYKSVGSFGKELMRTRLREANVDVLAAKDPDRLEKLFSILELKVTGADCARYFYRLKTCVGKR